MDTYREAKQLMHAEKYDEAICLIKPLAERGDAEAQFLMGYLWYVGADVEWEDSEKWLELAAKQNHAEAVYELAMARIDPGLGTMIWGPPESEEKMNLLRRAAELGSANAQRDVGCCLCTGEHGWEKDEAEGRKWYLRAAEQGHVEAQYDVGYMFLAGEGGEPDVPGGMSWLETAASNDLDPAAESAARQLADVYERGLFGVPADMEKARTFRNRAAELAERFCEEHGA